MLELNKEGRSRVELRWEEGRVESIALLPRLCREVHDMCSVYINRGSLLPSSTARASVIPINRVRTFFTKINPKIDIKTQKALNRHSSLTMKIKHTQQCHIPRHIAEKL